MTVSHRRIARLNPVPKSPAVARNAQSASQADLAYSQLLALIVSLDLQPSTQISEHELSQLVGYGRTPVREAVQRLASEHFCESLPRRGILIAPIDLAHQMDVWEVRARLEPGAARLAAERLQAGSPEDELRSLALAIQEEISPEGIRTPLLDERLHEWVARASQNRVLESMVVPLYKHSQRYWNFRVHRGMRRTSEILRDWEGIVSAILDRDPDAAEKLMARHVAGGASTVLRG